MLRVSLRVASPRIEIDSAVEAPKEMLPNTNHYRTCWTGRRLAAPVNMTRVLVVVRRSKCIALSESVTAIDILRSAFLYEFSISKSNEGADVSARSHIEIVKLSSAFASSISEFEELRS
jgi:hypothetical protein